MIHVFRRFLPLLLGPAGAFLGSLTGLALHQGLSRGVRYFWAPWLGWKWTIGLLAYPLLGFLIAIPFLSSYPGAPVRLRSDLGRAQDLHLRNWVAAFVSAYLPLGIGALYARWWGAPSLPIPFTDVYLYSGSRGDLVTVMIGVAVLGPFCGMGVERLLRGWPRWLRLAIGPPLATVLAMGGVLAAVLGAGAIATTWPEADPYGPLLQPLAQVGWDTGLLLALCTVVCGAFTGAFAAIGVGFPALAMLPDPTPAASRRRWAAPMLAVAVCGALAAAALVHGYGLDSLRWVQEPIRPGRTELVGTLVAPADQDVLQLHPEQEGFYLLEFPRPGARGRHWVSIQGAELPTARADRLRYLVEVPSYMPPMDVLVQPSWPTRTGVSEYSGPVRFDHVPVRSTEVLEGRRELELGPGQTGQWSFNVTDQPSELVLDPTVATRWTFLAGRVSYTGEWSYAQGWSVVFMRVTVDGKEVYSTVLGDEGHTLEAENLLVARAGDGPAPRISVWLDPATRPGETLTMPVIGEALRPGDPLLQARDGASVLAVGAGDQLSVRPEPGGLFTRVGVLPLSPQATGMSIQRLGDDGAWHPLESDLVMMGETELRVDGEPGAAAALVLGGASPTGTVAPPPLALPR